MEDIFSDLRLIAATNTDLYEKVKNSEFREDPYYRLRVFSIFLPHLRDKREDILPLIQHFITVFNLEFKKDVEGISEEALKILQDYLWPGTSASSRT